MYTHMHTHAHTNTHTHTHNILTNRHTHTHTHTHISHQICLKPAPDDEEAYGNMNASAVSDSVTESRHIFLLVAGGRVELPPALGKCLSACRNIDIHDCAKKEGGGAGGGHALEQGQRYRADARASSSSENLGDSPIGDTQGNGGECERSEWGLTILDDGKGNFQACTARNVREVLGWPLSTQSCAHFIAVTSASLAHAYARDRCARDCG